MGVGSKVRGSGFFLLSLLKTLHRFTCSLRVPGVLAPSSLRGKWFSSLSHRSSNCLFPWWVWLCSWTRGPDQANFWVQLSDDPGDISPHPPRPRLTASWPVCMYSSLGYGMGPAGQVLSPLPSFLLRSYLPVAAPASSNPWALCPDSLLHSSILPDTS